MLNARAILFVLAAGAILAWSEFNMAYADSYALHFSRDSQCVLVPDSNYLDVTGSLTVEAWVKPDGGILQKWFDFIVSKQMSGTGYALLTLGTDSSEHFQFETNVVVPGTSVPVIGQWTHVAGVWDNGQAKLYINGQLHSQRTAPNPPTANPYDLWIGSSPFGGDTNWRGSIDEVRIWAIARTEAEIGWDMQHGLTGNENGLRAYWSFDEGTGQVVGDTTGHNPGRLGNAPGPDAYDPEWVQGVDLASPGDTTPPTVIAHSPASPVEILSHVEVTFSEPIDEASFTPQDVQLTGPDGSIVVSGVTFVSDTTYGIEFADQKAPGIYSLTVGPAITDLADNQMASAYQAQLTVAPNADFMWVVTKGFSTVQGDDYGRALYGLRADGTGGLVPLYEPAALPAGSFFNSPRIRDGQVVFHAGTDLGHPDRGNIYLGSLGSDDIEHITNFGYRDIPAGSIVWNAAKDSVLFSNIWSGISKMDTDPATNDEVLLTTNYFDEVVGVSSIDQRIWFDNFMYRLPFHMYSMNQDGSGVQSCNPFTDGNYAIDGSISPDGLVLAVGKISPDRTTHFNGVWLADAATCTLLSPNPVISDTPFRSPVDGLSAWSPDSGSLAIIKEGQLWTFNMDGTNYHQLTTGTFGDLRVWGTAPNPSELCTWGDLDGDGDVDLRDYGIMQLHMTGPR